MKVSFACGKCATVLEADAQATGQAVACPKCGSALKVPTVRPGPGVTIGGFRIKKLIAVGGMGEVYLAEQLSLGRDVALKILPPHFKSDKETVAKFLAEVRVAARLQHPNLVTVYEAGEDHGIYFLAMAYIDGVTMDERLAKQGAMAETDALEIAQELGSALASAWESHKLIHCDVKPGNVMLDRNDKPHLMDMGLSKLLSESSTTSGAEAFGTPNYVSPEQSFNAPNLDFRSDMFSLGMTLYHMVTGKLPFDAPTPAETLHKLDYEQLPDPRTIVSGISPGCAVLLERMLGRKPESRYEDWESLLKDMSRVRKGGKPLRAALAPGKSVLARATTASAATGSLTKMRSAATPTEQKPKPPGDPIQGIVVLIVILAVLGGGAFLFRNQLRNMIHGKGFVESPLPVASVLPTNPPPSLPTHDAPPPPLTGADREKNNALRNLFDNARRYEMQHTNDFHEIKKRYALVQKQGDGTVWGDKAAIEVDRINAARAAALQEERKRLCTAVDKLVADGQTDNAIEMLRQYKGQFARVTEEERTQRIAELQAQLEKKRNNLEPDRVKLFLTSIADDLLRLDFVELKRQLAVAETNAILSASAECKSVCEMAAKMPTMSAQVLASFQRDIGKTVTVSTRNGMDQGEVAAISGDSVQLKKIFSPTDPSSGFAMVKYRALDLTIPEWMKRLGDNNAEQELMRGLLTYQLKAPDKARTMFEQANHPLGTLLAKRIIELQAATVEREKAATETAAKNAYTTLLHVVAPELAAQETDALLAAIQQHVATDDQRAKARNAVQTYNNQHGKTEWAKSHQEILAALADLNTKPVIKKRALIDVNAVQDATDKAISRLQDDNPGDPLRYKVSIESDGVILILRGNASLRDIRALDGLPIKQLDLSRCTTLKNIDILANFGLLSSLKLSGTAITSVHPLRSTQLRELWLRGCENLTNLVPLRECPLQYLDIRECSRDIEIGSVAKIPGIKINKD
jgi:serine/threonine protein kinase/DNA-directed RNA polymerase subunit RPC12/RpoP